MTTNITEQKQQNSEEILSSQELSEDITWNLKQLLTHKLLTCPIDKGEVVQKSTGLFCKTCNLKFPNAEINSLCSIIDFRCTNSYSEVKINFQIPQTLLDDTKISQLGYATKTAFKCMSREEIRKKFKTKLQKEILYYIEQLKHELGSDIQVLDLGCGSGGNKLFLNSVGFKNVFSVDYWSNKAEILVDAHRLPFKDASFDVVLTTATIEHFYNPFIAFAEISRVLKPGGALIASGSFWESWHDQSCFHFTPNGFFLLCTSAGLSLEDLWSGWGFIPSILSHALNLRGLKKYTYKLQDLFDAVLRLRWGENFAFRHRLKTSGSFGIYARKTRRINSRAEELASSSFR